MACAEVHTKDGPATPISLAEEVVKQFKCTMVSGYAKFCGRRTSAEKVCVREFLFALSAYEWAYSGFPS